MARFKNSKKKYIQKLSNNNEKSSLSVCMIQRDLVFVGYGQLQQQQL